MTSMRLTGMKIGRRAALALALVTATSGFAFAQQTLKFGLAMPLTGGQASYGNDQVKAAQWAVEEINKAGGINGKKFEMVVLDTQADPQVGIQAVNRLISVDKVPVFITAWSGVVKAVAPIANDNKIVELSIGANAPWQLARVQRMRAAPESGRTGSFGRPGRALASGIVPVHCQ